MPRPKVNLDPHEAEICRLRRSKVPLQDIVHLLDHKYGIKVAVRTVNSRLSEWGFRANNRKAAKDTVLHARLKALMYEDGLDDQQILTALQREGFDINARTLKYVRHRLGFLRRQWPLSEPAAERDTETQPDAESTTHTTSPDAAQSISPGTTPAPQAISLPTIAQIEGSTEVLSSAGDSARVVRVNERFAVKSGTGVLSIEAENLIYLAENSAVPIPKVYSTLQGHDTAKTYIIMDYIPGDNLEKLLPTLSRTEKDIINKLVKEAIANLRKIAPPGYLGMLHRRPYLHGIFWTEGSDPKLSGPFAYQKEMNLAILEKLGESESEAYMNLLRSMVKRTLKRHRTVFTHGDLQPRNIMVERLGTRNGEPNFKITLVDWETAGWYPEFWDFCNAAIASQFKPDWLELTLDILDQYPLEFMMMQVVYSSVFAHLCQAN